MFDLGFGEVSLILVVALIVLGPERLPKVARAIGRLLGKLRTLVAQVKTDLASQIDDEDFKELGDTLRQSAQLLRDQMQTSLQDLESQVDEIRQDLGRSAWQRLPPMRSPEDFANGLSDDFEPAHPVHSLSTSISRMSLQQKSRQHRRRTKTLPRTPRRLHSRHWQKSS